ncbi:hypothetical protein ACFQY7_54360 [Actinomadura luteofluorescens]|uniref:hypothetical protein n=1 Tax=Actinomadura luteofluorescens TaxID=46163 RepID=UPI00363A69E4
MDAEPFEPVVARAVELPDEAGVALGVGPQVADAAPPLRPVRRAGGPRTAAPRTGTAFGAGSSSNSMRVPDGTCRISSSATTTVRERGRCGRAASS